MMNITKFTQKSVEILNSLEKIAYDFGAQEIVQEHLLYGMLTIEDSLLKKLIEKMEIDSDVFLAQVEELGALDSRFEMERIGLFDGLPEKLTYPWIAPVLYRHLQELLYGKDESGNANG